MTEGKGSDTNMKGWLLKWTNYLKGYQRRYFVLSNGMLSYYRAEYSGGTKLSIRRRRRSRVEVNQAEVMHTCRGSISLHGAIIHTEESCSFVISNGGTQTFHIKAFTEVERQRWVTALELAKAQAIHLIESEEEEEFGPGGVGGLNTALEGGGFGGLGGSGGRKGELTGEAQVEALLQPLVSRLEELNTCCDLIGKHRSTLQRSIADLESVAGNSSAASDESSEAGTTESAVSVPTLLPKVRAIIERATLFRITSDALRTRCVEYVDLARTELRKWQRILQHERDQRLRLEEMVEQLARQHSHLEQAAKEHQTVKPSLRERNAHHSSPSDEDEENEFYDAMEETQSNFILTIPTGHRRTSSGMSNASQASDGCNPPDGQDEASGSSSEVDEVGGETTTVCVITAKSSEDLGSAGSEEKKQSASASPSTSVPPSPTSAALSSIGDGAGSSQANGSVVKPRRKRRTKVPDKPNYPLNLWSIMKNCIGQELSKIPMPVNFSEPLSMLQRLTEDYEYADILDKAAACCPNATGGDSCEQLAYVAAFTVSSYSTTSNRTGKPFNPLLGETYECDRTDDFGWRSISEQVSHHPPMVAQYCEGKEWRCWQEFTMASKFRGKYLQVIPLGTAHLEFNASGNHYTWRKVTTTVHNIIVGKLWVDQSGDMDIVNHKTGDKCHLKYIPYSYFTRDVQRKVKGCVVDKDGNVKWVVTGMWDNKIEIAKVTSSQGSPENPVFKTGPSRLVWKRRMPPPDSERYYNFTELACQLNEEEEGVCPTDSRHRPDQRLMEQGQWDAANAEKLRLEEKQRAARRKREAEAEKAAADEEIKEEIKGRPYPPYEPVWFKKQTEPYTGKVFHVYQGKYWENKERGDWSMCPDIF
ncbi:oxysterol-binding protein 1 isoform X2 [Ischnura elegans]|uniref:oxysterol-binding protein 1 isoform X2 n=1 Tax=Ischnura elegans TaxID=197161 RepID=UPI001ED8A508|nr:oxysterol-binding protein 1 isoform X2 [Ischnura elegans]